MNERKRDRKEKGKGLENMHCRTLQCTCKPFIVWDLRFSRGQVCRWMSSGLLRRVIWYIWPIDLIMEAP